jgi:hypothetical protein
LHIKKILDIDLRMMVDGDDRYLVEVGEEYAKRIERPGIEVGICLDRPFKIVLKITASFCLCGFSAAIYLIYDATSSA